jgi:hypothetical protein
MRKPKKIKASEPLFSMKRHVWPVDRPKPYGGNARTHPPAQIDLLAKLIFKFGQDQDVVVDENEDILKGHGRQIAMKLAGLTEMNVTQRFGLSEADKRAMRISDNQVALLSGWDNTLLRNEVSALKSIGYDIPLLGFGDAQILQFMTTPQPPAGFQTFDETIPVNCQCPRCGYKGSGDWSVKPDKPEKPKKPKAKKK